MLVIFISFLFFTNKKKRVKARVNVTIFMEKKMMDRKTEDELRTMHKALTKLLKQNQNNQFCRCDSEYWDDIFIINLILVAAAVGFILFCLQRLRVRHPPCVCQLLRTAVHY